jgi:hypothetical protein
MNGSTIKENNATKIKQNETHSEILLYVEQILTTKLSDEIQMELKIN